MVKGETRVKETIYGFYKAQHRGFLPPCLGKSVLNRRALATTSSLSFSVPLIRKHAELQPIVRVGSERNSASGFGGRAGRRGKSGERLQRRAGSGVMENRNRGQGTISGFDKAKRDPVDWAAVHLRAEALSAAHTISSGHRLADILHVARALHLGVTEFLTFDSNQKKLAQAEGLRALSLSVPLTSIFDFLK